MQVIAIIAIVLFALYPRAVINILLATLAAIFITISSGNVGYGVIAFIVVVFPSKKIGKRTDRK